MNVLHVVTTASPFFRDQIDALERRGISCTTVEVPAADGTLRSLDAYRRCYQRLLKESLGSYDVVHANYGLVGPLALAQPRRPVVLTLWGSELMGDSDRLETVTRFAADHSDAVVVPSAPISRAVNGEHEIVPFPVDTDTFRPIPQAAARDAIGWETDDRIVLFPYHPDRTVKNYPRAKRVVEAAERLVDAAVDLRWIWGVPHDEVPLYLNASDAVLITSNRESGPMTVKEAAACNVPVVSTPVGFAPAELDDVEHSHVAVTEEGLVEALTAVLQAGERSDGRTRIRAPDRDRVGALLEGVYTDVIDAAGDGR